MLHLKNVLSSILETKARSYSFLFDILFAEMGNPLRLLYKPNGEVISLREKELLLNFNCSYIQLKYY